MGNPKILWVYGVLSMPSNSCWIATAVLVSMAASGAKAAEPKPADFTLPDVLTGKPVALADFKDRKAVVAVFLGMSCPINNAYLPRLAELAKEYGVKRVQFIGINSNRIDSAKDVADHAKKNHI